MACLDEEKTSLENAFNLSGATFTIASSRMIGDNTELLALTTVEGHTFVWVKNQEENAENQLVGNDRDEH
jgi:hypothetical protein